MTAIVNELSAIQHDVADRKPTVREKTAAAAFLAQFYMGIENILKRLSRYYDVTLPEGETWHVELFQRFAEPGYANLPVIFDSNLAALLAPYRRFRHVAFHGYGFQLEWQQMAEGVAEVTAVFQQFKASLHDYL